MRRLISLFHEPNDDYAPSKADERPPAREPADQPLYYLALISYLQERQREADSQAKRETSVR
jgi:hypothetical protein